MDKYQVWFWSPCFCLIYLPSFWSYLCFDLHTFVLVSLSLFWFPCLCFDLLAFDLIFCFCWTTSSECLLAFLFWSSCLFKISCTPHRPSRKNAYFDHARPQALMVLILLQYKTKMSKRLTCLPLTGIAKMEHLRFVHAEVLWLSASTLFCRQHLIFKSTALERHCIVFLQVLSNYFVFVYLSGSVVTICYLLLVLDCHLLLLAYL